MLAAARAREQADTPAGTQTVEPVVHHPSKKSQDRRRALDVHRLVQRSLAPEQQASTAQVLRRRDAERRIPRTYRARHHYQNRILGIPMSWFTSFPFA